MSFALEAGEARAVIDPERGGRIRSLRVFGLELLVEEQADPIRWGCYPMAPFAGRVRGARFPFAGRSFQLEPTLPPHAIHGTVHRRAWQHAGGGRLVTELGPGWPFPGHAVQQLDLAPDGLSLSLEVHAEHEPFPASLGWHPWLRRRLERGDEALLSFQARAMYLRDAEGLPTGATIAPPPGPWDDCFTGLAAPPVVTWPGALRLEIAADVDHFVIYDEPEHALCVEPQTGPPDALHLAPRPVEPGRPLVANARLRWRRA